MPPQPSGSHPRHLLRCLVCLSSCDQQREDRVTRAQTKAPAFSCFCKYPNWPVDGFLPFRRLAERSSCLPISRDLGNCCQSGCLPPGFSLYVGFCMYVHFESFERCIHHPANIFFRLELPTTLPRLLYRRMHFTPMTLHPQAPPAVPQPSEPHRLHLHRSSVRSASECIQTGDNVTYIESALIPLTFVFSFINPQTPTNQMKLRVRLVCLFHQRSNPTTCLRRLLVQYSTQENES